MDNILLDLSPESEEYKLIQKYKKWGDNIISPIYWNNGDNSFELVYITEPMKNVYKLIRVDQSKKKGFTHFYEPNHYIITIDKNKKDNLIKNMK